MITKNLKGIGKFLTIVGLFLAHSFSADAQSPSGRRVVMVYLKGAADSLGMVQPDQTQIDFQIELSQLRRTLRRSDAQLLVLPNKGLGLHPTLTALQTINTNGQLAIIQKVGINNLQTNHQLAEAAMAAGVPSMTGTENSGWLQRLGAQYGFNYDDIVDLSGGHATTSAGGNYRPLVLDPLNGFNNLPATVGAESNFRLSQLFRTAEVAQPSSAEETLLNGHLQSLGRTFDAFRQATTTLPAGYGGTVIERNFRDAEIAFSSFDTKVVFISYPGFDTVARQDVNMNGTLSTQLRNLSNAVNRFRLNMQTKNLWGSTIIVVYTEFGRTLSENIHLGTDDGGGQTVLVFGGAVKGGVYGSMITANEAVDKSDRIPVQINYVDILSDIVATMGYDGAPIFPGFNRAPIGFLW